MPGYEQAILKSGHYTKTVIDFILQNLSPFTVCLYIILERVGFDQ